MYYNWLDRWDERRAQRGEEWKLKTNFALGGELAFPGKEPSTTLSEFCDLADQAVADAAYFAGPISGDDAFDRRDGWLRFRSDITTDVEENNVVVAKITDGGCQDRALVVFHHWNATSWNHQLANFFAKRGITVVEIAMPYHFERSRPGSRYADFMLSANIGRTLESMKQAVLDGRKLIRWLESQGYREISLLGMSLGSWVAGLIAAHDRAVSKTSLLLTAGSLADMVWTGRATRSIRKSLEPAISLCDLRQAWAPLNLGNYSNGFSRPDLKLQVVLATRDTVVINDLSRSFLQSLWDAGVTPAVLKLNCGHYSLGRPPYIVITALSLRRFLVSGRTCPIHRGPCRRH
ncbi:dienelactone hydrolase [Rhizobium wenxiniae]|uniref:Dienelactone hydrolase n=1 Tax=Rhizobium wenxiniae TaxID=1737357 RepID=A0A7W9YB28_9HYPH|nr:dienelactone hydrolase-related enzyme [Rhizobium wenxiniae]MBB6165246.1 dienelactone hydrolase [Rhizobium wenxiniae]